jgi:hypothetical protein
MIDPDFQPLSHGDELNIPILIAKLHYPESQWGEDITLFATQTEAGFAFEANDFYGNDIVLEPNFSQRPLPLRELILMIETMKPADESFAGNLELTLMGIPEATSEFYPGLAEYFLEKRKRLGLE